jgi:hypothetical protein
LSTLMARSAQCESHLGTACRCPRAGPARLLLGPRHWHRQRSFWVGRLSRSGSESPWARLASPSRPRPRGSPTTAGTHLESHQPASPYPTSASPRGHCGTAYLDRMLTSSVAFGESYTSPLSVLGGPAVCRVGLFPRNKRTLPDQSPGRSSRRLKRAVLPPESSSQCQRVALETCVLAR